MNRKHWFITALCTAVITGTAGCSKHASSAPEETAFPSYEENENAIDLAEDSYLMYQKDNVMVGSTAVILYHEDTGDRISFNMTVQNGSDAEIKTKPQIESLVLEGEAVVKDIQWAEPEKEVLKPGEQNGYSADLFLESTAEPDQLITISGMITVNDAEGNPLSEMQNFTVVLNEEKYTPAPEDLTAVVKVETDFAVYEAPDQIETLDGEMTQLYYMVQDETVRHSISPDFMSDFFSVYVRDLSDYSIYFGGQEVPAGITLDELNDAIASWRSNPDTAGEYLTGDYKESLREKMTIGGKDALRVVSDYVMPDSSQRIYSDITFVAVGEGKVLSIVNTGYEEKYNMFSEAVKKVRETITFPASGE